MEPSMKKAAVSLVLLLVVAASSSAQQTAFPVKVSENGRYFVDQDGTPVFWLGMTQWQLICGYTLDEAKTVLEETHKNGFSFVQVMLLGVGDGATANVFGQKAWNDKDSLAPNEAYFKHVDSVIRLARDNNLTVWLLVYHQTYRKYLTSDKARPWGKWLAERYKDAPNLVWSMAPEAKQKYVPILRDLAAGLREGDGGCHLITVEPDPSPYSSSFIHNESWLDFNSIQAWNGLKLIYPMVTHDYNLTPVKPVLMAEGAYEAGPKSKYGFEVPSLWIRRQAYYSYLAGAHHTYGYNDSWKIPATWRRDLNSPGAVQMGVLRRIFQARKEWWLLAPDQSLFSSGGRISETPLAQDYATDKERSAYVRSLGALQTDDQSAGALLHLAARHRDGNWAMFYLADKATFSVDLSKLSPAKLNVFWVDPRTGESLPAGQESNQTSPRAAFRRLEWAEQDANRSLPPIG